MTFVAFLLFLLVAFVGGGVWAVHHLRQNYSSKTPLPIPQLETTPPEAGPAASDDGVAPTTTGPSSATIPQGAVTPGGPATPLASGSAPERWKAFEKAARRGEKARIELTASDINALLADGKNTRGKASVSIENNVGHVTVSVPLEKVMFMNGRYVNGQATVQASPDGDPAKGQISNVTIGNQSVPDDFIDRRIFGWSTIRGYIMEWLDDENIASFRIENNRAIAETR